MKYIRINNGLRDNAYKLVPASDDIYNYIDDNKRDYYSSIFQYNQEQYDQWKLKGSIAGIKDVTTNKLVWDFDSKSNVEESRQDALSLISKLIKDGVAAENIQVAFSGNKGFAVSLDTTEEYTPSEFKNITSSLAEGLKTFDPVVSDPARIFRVLGTKHNVSGLYKYPLSVNQLSECDVEVIKEMAAGNPENNVSVMEQWTTVNVPKSYKELKHKAKEEKIIVEKVSHDLDMTRKPKWLSEAKYALQCGYFDSGERNTALMVLCATYNAQGLPKVVTYRMLKGVAELQAQRTGTEAFDSAEIWNNIVNTVYGSHWTGGAYGPEHPLLKAVTERLGLSAPKKDDDTPGFIHDIHSKFKDYVNNIDKNTIRTGIKSLDDKVFISVGANVGIVGAPGSGKSALALEILSNTSRAGIKSVFCSFDMHRSRMYEKILYRVSGKTRTELYKIFKENPIQEQMLHEKIKEDFGNVYFYDKSAATVSDIKKYIESCNELAADPKDKIKLVMVDYFELIDAEGVGDETAASKRVAQQLQSVVNTMDVAQIVLLQPNKMSGDMREPIKSYTNIKGSSFLAQSFRIALGICREGFDPDYPEDDRFLSINIVKNDLGETGHLDYSWEGRRGKITELDSEGIGDLKALRAEIKRGKDEKGSL